MTHRGSAVKNHPRRRNGLNRYPDCLNWNQSLVRLRSTEAAPPTGEFANMPTNGTRPFASRSRRRKRLHRAPRTASSATTRLQEENRPELVRLRGVAGIRRELVARIREEIRAGTYDTPAKFAAAFERMCDCMAAD